MTDQVKTRGRKCTLTTEQQDIISDVVVTNGGTIKEASDKAQCSYAVARYYLIHNKGMSFKRGRPANTTKEVVTADA